MPAFFGGEIEDSQEIGLEIRNMQHTFKLNDSGILPFKDRFKLYRAKDLGSFVGKRPAVPEKTRF